MSERVTIPKPQEETASGETQARISQPIVELLQEIMQTPREYWPNLLKMIRLFRETANEAPKVSDVASKPQADTIDPVQQHQALTKLFQSWRDEGDEEEQTETAEFLRKALDEDRLSN